MPHQVDVQIGANIRRVRTHRLISQAALADALKRTLQTIQRYERGTLHVPEDRIPEIAKLLNVEPAVLLDDNGAAARVRLVTKFKTGDIVSNKSGLFRVEMALGDSLSWVRSTSLQGGIMTLGNVETFEWNMRLTRVCSAADVRASQPNVTGARL